MLYNGDEMKQREQIEEAVRKSETQQAGAAECSGLVRGLHDAVTQTLFSASLIAETLPTIWESDQDEGRRLLEELRQLSRDALAEMRTLLLELPPAATCAPIRRSRHEADGHACHGRVRGPG